MPDPKPTGLSAVDARVGNASFALGMTEKIVEGRYGDAAVQGGMRIAFTPGVYKAVADLSHSVAPVQLATKVASTSSFIAKNLPIIGGIVLAAYDAKEVYDHVKKGDYKGAAVAAAAGVAEVAATTAFGGLAGAGARTLIVEGVAAAGGPRVNDAALVAVTKEAVKLGVKGVEKGSKFVQGLGGAEQHPQTVVAAAPKEDKPTTPTTPRKKTQPAMSMG
ncbi:MAG: hypothetical protein EPN97_14625 [Alphaproteobacteria bacterium]|nr:MAG: hypothetical protein EPN97_14625 [Alphaproteobacteria bacterium]